MFPLSRVGFLLHKTLFVSVSSKRVWFIFTSDKRLSYRGASEMAVKSHSLALGSYSLVFWIDLHVFVRVLQMTVEVGSCCNTIGDFCTTFFTDCPSCLVLHLVIFISKRYDCWSRHCLVLSSSWLPAAT